ncbi:MAG: AraC family transcriptional regulator [Xenococcaceae cyanobacterium MO_188.B19]|nr:AraC family transcriptional regulator [Xenococcaceae cyanobacterium MO_188.B19]
MSEEYPFPTDLQGEKIEHTHLLSSEQAGWDNLNLIYEIEPAGEMPEAVSPDHALVICLGDCQGKYKLDGKWHQEQYSVGDIVIFPAGELFPRFRIDRPTPLLEIFLAPDTLINAAAETVPSKIKLSSHFKLRDPLIQQMGLALKAELEMGGVDSKLYADSMATALSIHLMRRYASRTPQIKEYREGLPPYKLEQVIEYIRVNLERDLTLTRLANLVQISPHYFAGLFKKSTGLTPHQYVTKCRLEQAKILLRQSYLPIIEICYQVGFQNQSHFTRLFRQHFQITPKAYRNL